MGKLFGVLYALLMLLKSYTTEKEQKDAQQQANEIEQDPTDWFNTHFDGGLSDGPDSAATGSGKATHLRIDGKQSDVHEPTGRQ